MFMGEYHHTIDTKGRLTIPAKVRNDLGNDFVMTRGIDNCLYIYKSDDWKKIIETYKSLPNTKDARAFMRFFMSGASVNNFDNQGRVNIASLLINYAKLDKDCVVIGVNDRLEVWDKITWENYMNTNESDLSDIAEKLFDRAMDY